MFETGQWPAREPDPFLVRLNFVALVTALDALASDRVRSADKAGYESLPMNGSNVFYALVRNATVVSGTGIPPFTADIGIAGTRVVREVDGVRQAQVSARIDDLGDLEPFGALDDIDATGLVAAPISDRALTEGAMVTLPDWAAAPAGQTIAPGQPAQFVLLAPTATTGLYRVSRVIRY